MWAVLSDIHSNLEALDAVLADIAKHPVSHVFCLGDLVNYGPSPVECLDRAMAGRWDVTLLGNHDLAAMFDPDGFGLTAEQAIFWTRSALEATNRSDLWEFLAERPRSHRYGDFLFVHGSARNPLNEYVFPEDVLNAPKMSKLAALIDRYCFAGHTHVPGVFVEPREADTRWQFISPAELPGFYRLDGRRTIINAGSVGQPRDGDRRAGYVLIDGWDVIFRRVEYDVDTTVRKIYAIPELANFLGDRLHEGR